MADAERAKSKNYNKYVQYSTQRYAHIQNKLRTSSTFCDASIQLDDGVRIPVHRVILCSASEYFQ